MKCKTMLYLIINPLPQLLEFAFLSGVISHRIIADLLISKHFCIPPFCSRARTLTNTAVTVVCRQKAGHRTGGKFLPQITGKFLSSAVVCSGDTIACNQLVNVEPPHARLFWPHDVTT